MTAHGLCKNIGRLLVASMLSANAYAVTDISTTPLATYSDPSSTIVKPNLMFILDDSGSMDWDYMPDWANANSPPAYLSRNNAFNGVAYNPAVTYSPPVSSYTQTGASYSAIYYPSMNGTSTTNGADSSAKPNWKAVPDDKFGVQSTSSSNLENNAYFWTIVAGEYCNAPSMRTCQTGSSGSYTYPAKLRWCNSSALTICQAAWSSTYNNWRAPSPRTATITVSGSNSSSVTHITVNGLEILSAATSSSSTASTVATNIKNAINACTSSITGSCGISGYSATVSGSMVTISAPGSTSATPDIAKTGSMTLTPTAFAPGAVAGENLRTNIVSTTNSYPYPGTSAKALTRTDCAGTTCTYNEEMTNYANWWAYYHTRMQMMKSATGRAFSSLSDQIRVGYMSINNNKGNDFLNIADFNLAQRNAWNTKLNSANPGSSTPLRPALSNVGRLYAGKLNGTSFNGSTVTDPLQYSCQQNYSLLSTDGFWNAGAGYKLDGSTAVGNQDGVLPRPYNDGATSSIQKRTSTLQQRSGQRQSSTSTLQTSTSTTQSRTSQLQKQTSQLQKRTSSNYGSTWTAWANVPSGGSCTPDNYGQNRTECQYVDSAWSNATSCTPVNKVTSGTWYVEVSTQCQYTPWTAWSTVTSCTAMAQDTSGTWNVPTATECQTAWSPYTNVSSCTTNATTRCQYSAWTGWTPAASCTDVARSTSNPYNVETATQCQTTWSPSWTTAFSACTATTTNQCQYTPWTGWNPASSCEPVEQDYINLEAVQCQATSTGGTSDTLADVAAYYYNTDLRTSALNNCTGPIIAPATTANDLCANNVPDKVKSTATDPQRMTTFTLGLGAPGKMQFQSDWSAIPTPAGDYNDVKQGNLANTTTGACSWQANGTQCNWPTPASDSIANIDDLWHAAVNGHGDYLSATSPDELAAGINNMLTTISEGSGQGATAAAASSNPNISTSDNYIFSSSYKTKEWYGELIRQQIDLTSATLTVPQWSAQAMLDCAMTSAWAASHTYAAGDTFINASKCYGVKDGYTSGATFDATVGGVTNIDTTSSTLITASPPAGRTIYTKGASALIPFQWASLSDDVQKPYFSTPNIAGLSQFCASGAGCLSAAGQTAAQGENLVNFLRGNRTYEGAYYRQRTHILGDIVSSGAKHVKASLFNYTDPGYADFKTLKANRDGTVYVAANDGMLHAFNAETGAEKWAYIPSMVLPDLYKLADKNYATQHQYFVDGSPETGDICPSAPCSAGEWRTILVGGQNRGGKGYYALDITDPANPSLLWEFTHSTLGYTYGNPNITKLKNGTWVVLLTSGYNNADGVGRLYVLNASTGQLISTIGSGGIISTGVGTVTNPSGLARISAHVPNSLADNTVQAVYGGDLYGNLWRFDVNNDIGAAGYDAQLLASFKDASGNAQPITTEPVVTTVNSLPVVYVGTGRYLGTSDISNTQSQSFYAVVDRLGSTTYGNPRTAGSGFVKQTLTDASCPANSAFCTSGQTIRTINTTAAVNLNTDNGWFMDFFTGGERSVTNPALGLGTLVFTTIAPQLSSASACGAASNATASFFYALDYLTGGAVTGANGVASVSLGNVIAAAPIMAKLPDGTVITLTPVTSLDGGGGKTGLVLTKPPMPPSIAAAKRVSWRELVTE